MKLRRFLYVAGSVILILVVFLIDLARKNVELDVAGLGLLRNLMVIGAVVLATRFLMHNGLMRVENPTRKLGLILIGTVIVALFALVLNLVGSAGFEAKEGLLLPLTYGTIFSATVMALLFGVFAGLVLIVLRDLVLYKRKRGSERNFKIFVGLTLLASASAILLDPLETSVLVSILFGLAVLSGVVNAFRLSWIVYLTKREKVFALVYSFLLFVVFLPLNIVLHQTEVSRALAYYSSPLRVFVEVNGIFATIYFGMAFIGTLFHLPTAEAFERKTSEVSSMHNLSKLTTQVFDFSELVDSVTSMTLQVVEAKSCWLELIHSAENAQSVDAVEGLGTARPLALSNYLVQIAGMKNISQQEIDLLLPAHRWTARDELLQEQRPIVVDDIAKDPRFEETGQRKEGIGSLVVVPLVSYGTTIGVLYATKETPHGFFKDDVEVISAFADQATVAIENSRLIKKSLERERLVREMMLAQEMQRKLLPQRIPQLPGLELDAHSTPAFEVGGDYYDYAALDNNRLGIIVGDVSGKGLSAAFYMSEVKGIFQALSRLHHSPKEFMVKANEALHGSLDRHSFVSLIYAVLDRSSGVLKIARAGHCPLLLLSRVTVAYVRPTGMGLGMSDRPVFSESMEEHSIRLSPGDVCVFYTDGVTEAHRGDEEFGYDRLLQAAERVKDRPVTEIKNHILSSVQTFMGQEAYEDDLTLVVLKWHGTRA
jgi:sigma-B regulation protein RsbU (phosphoserine phosphatase)